MAEPSRKERERTIREQAIIEAAEQIFTVHGFEEASMDEIAKKAEFTKRTIYQYFVNKEDLYFAVVLKEFKEIEAFLRETLKDTKTGYGKLERMMTGIYRYQQAYPDTFLLISRWSAIKRKYSIETPASLSLNQFNVALFKSIEMIIEEGFADGTIQSEMSAAESGYSIAYLTLGFMSNFALTGESFSRFLNLDSERFCLSSLGLILKSFKGTKKSAH